jgi:hypothetical protein
MNASTNTHPARSPEFLSRLHDQELSAAERAHFESHRAHCAECRTAAADFEAALALFRASGPKPASPDLAGRILRKLQQNEASSRRRLHFGPTFGIDLRWAGAFAAAVIAVVVASSVVVQNESRQPAIHATLPSTASEEARKKAEEPVSIERGRAHADSRLSDSAAAPQLKAPASEPVPAPAGAREERSAGAALDKDEKLSGSVGFSAGYYSQDASKQKELVARGDAPALQTAPAPAAPPPAARPADQLREDANGFAEKAQAPSQSAAANNRSEDDRRRNAQVSQRQQTGKNSIEIQNQSAQAGSSANNVIVAQSPSVQAYSRDGERAGGDAGNFQNEQLAVRLAISAIDGAGAAPDLLAGSTTEVPASLKGQEFVVIVDMAGRVIQATPQKPPPAEEKAEKPAADEAKRAKTKSLAKAAATPPPPFAGVRFQPGARQRRLLIRVE